MKALTLHQPWATLVAISAKKIETRSWDTTYRGPLAIHAGKEIPKNWRFMDGDAWREVLGPLVGLNDYGLPNIDRLPRGEIIAVAHLSATVPISNSIPHVTRIGAEHEPEFGDYTPGRFAWLFGAVRALKTPVPCRGRQRLWEMPKVEDLLLRAIETQARAVRQAVWGDGTPMSERERAFYEGDA